MNNPPTQDQQFITQYKKLFLNNIHEIKIIISSITNEVKISDDFIQILLLVYQVIILEDLPAIETLITSDLLLAASKTCRSILEISAITSYLYKLDSVERKTKSRSFIDFTGGEVRQTGKSTEYDWLKTTTNISIKDIIIAQGLDLKNIIDFGFTDDHGKQIKLSIYDLLSKIVHYNPKFLTQLVRVNRKKFQTYYPPAYIYVYATTILATIHSTIQFCLIFLEHLHPSAYQKEKEQLVKMYSELTSNLHIFSEEYKTYLKSE